MGKNGEKLFTINQIANLCSISRATLIRMEEDGILQPAYKNPDNGYRYYDSENAITVIHNLSLQRLGLTHKEIKSYTPEGDYGGFLDILEKKQRHLEDLISEIRARLTAVNEFKIEEVWPKACTCYTKTIYNVRYISVIPGFVRETLVEAINKGYVIDWRIPNCVMTEAKDFLEGRFYDRPHDFTACIPIGSTKGHTRDENILTFESARSVSILLAGDSRNIRDACMKLRGYLEDNGLVPCGKGKFMGIINEFPRYEDPENNHAARIVVPVCSCNEPDQERQTTSSK